MFATRIKYLRQSAGINQVQLAEKLGVSKQSISNWENDNIMPSIDMLVKIADFLLLQQTICSDAAYRNLLFPKCSICLD